MLQALAKAGCPVDRRFFTVETCEKALVGGFRPPDGVRALKRRSWVQADARVKVVLCHNQIVSATEFENALVHELVHAFDHCRAADLSWSNCRHHACSEVRAANLSGDCSFSQELLRGNLGITGQHKACVRRRATLSVQQNPACGKPGAARAAVDGCLEECLRDTAPFERAP
jgi:inner membrane protease ATP23